VAAEKACGLVVRATDFSETSRVVTIWTRELGKVRALAKGGRRLRSGFESALDLLTVCSIVLLRKSSGALDLLTEACVEERFPRLRGNLPALYAAYYIAELLGDWTEDYDAHPGLFDEARATLRELGGVIPTGLRLMRFETVLLRELGYQPVLDACASCKRALPAGSGVFSASAGGLLCSSCQHGVRGVWKISPPALAGLRQLADEQHWRTLDTSVRTELREVFNHYISYLLGRRPRTMPYLGS
jgi:DNA repair protein RecO (recombination protein O)